MMGMGDIIDKLFNYKDDEDSWSDGSTDESKIVNTNLATFSLLMQHQWMQF